MDIEKTDVFVFHPREVWMPVIRFIRNYEVKRVESLFVSKMKEKCLLCKYETDFRIVYIAARNSTKECEFSCCCRQCTVAFHCCTFCSDTIRTMIPILKLFKSTLFYTLPSEIIFKIIYDSLPNILPMQESDGCYGAYGVYEDGDVVLAKLTF